jgi:hypothetical protein
LRFYGLSDYRDPLLAVSLTFECTIITNEAMAVTPPPFIALIISGEGKLITIFKEAACTAVFKF